MRQYYFFKTLRKAIIQFLDMFNDMEIAKYNDDGEITKYVKVPLKLASKQKFYY